MLGGRGLARPYPGSGAWAVEEDDDKRSLLATVDQLRTELQARDSLVETLRQEIDLLYSCKRTSPVAVVSRQKRAEVGHPHLDDLPDDLLLRVFSYLDGLFLASVTSDVCQRWRTLVRDPSLWCDVVLRYYGNPNGSVTDARLFARALEVAPAVDSLECGFLMNDPPALLRAVETCGTAATHLCVDLDTAAPDAVLQLLRNSRQILTVFCLREGPMSPSHFSPSQAGRFWQMIEAAPKLQSLVLFLSQRSGLASCLHPFKALPPERATLRTLFVDVGVLDVDKDHGELGVTVQLLIRAHQSTLVDVHLPMRVATPGALRAASRCQGLRCLSTQASADVVTLKNCSGLRELRLTMGKALLSHYNLIQTVGELKQVTKLRVVQLPPRTDDDLSVSAGLLSAVSPHSALRELSLTCLPSPAALDKLAVPPLAVPKLELLLLNQSCGDVVDGGCRLPAVRRLVYSRPGLHVMFKSVAVRGDAGGASTNRCSDDHCSLATQGHCPPFTFVGHPREHCRLCQKHVRVGGTVLLLAPVEAPRLQWCDVTASGDVHGSVLADDVRRSSEEAPDVTASVDVLADDVRRSSQEAPDLRPIMVSIPLSKVDMCAKDDGSNGSSECLLAVDVNDATGDVEAPTEAPAPSESSASASWPARRNLNRTCKQSPFRDYYEDYRYPLPSTRRVSKPRPPKAPKESSAPRAPRAPRRSKASQSRAPRTSTDLAVPRDAPPAPAAPALDSFAGLERLLGQIPSTFGLSPVSTSPMFLGWKNTSPTPWFCTPSTSSETVSDLDGHVLDVPVPAETPLMHWAGTPSGLPAGTPGVYEASCTDL